GLHDVVLDGQRLAQPLGRSPDAPVQLAHQWWTGASRLRLNWCSRSSQRSSTAKPPAVASASISSSLYLYEHSVWMVSSSSNSIVSPIRSMPTCWAPRASKNMEIQPAPAS